MASKAFKAAMLSAHRQLTGILGSSLPSKRINWAESISSAGSRPFINGFSRIPSMNNFFDSRGTE